MLNHRFFLFLLLCALIFSCSKKQVKNGNYLLINKATGKCLDLNIKCLEKNGCNVQLWDIREEKKNQIWSMEKIDNNNDYKIISYASGNVLDADQSTLEQDAGEVQVWDWMDRDNQIWRIESVDKEYFHIIMNHVDKYLSIPKQTDRNGAPVQLLDLDNTGSDHQQWKFEPKAVPELHKVIQ